MSSLLLDQGVPHSAAKLLCALGIDAIHVADLGLCAASDSVILRHAQELGRVVCTLDSDFHALMALCGAAQPSVILIRAQQMRGPAATALIKQILERTQAALDQGALATASIDNIRVRRLPVKSNNS